MADHFLGWGGLSVMAGLFFGIVAGGWTCYEQLKPLLAKSPRKGKAP